jgi:PAS domain S-box-containing protein
MVFVKEAKSLCFVRFNKAGEDLLGIPREQLIGKNDYDFFPKEQADAFIKKDRAVLSGREAVDIPEEPIQTVHRGNRILHTRKIPLFGPDGKPIYLLGISEDITESKIAEERRLQLIRKETAGLEREKSVRRLANLAEVSASLVSTLNYHEALQEVAKLLVPGFCDLISFTIEREEGKFERVVTLHRDPSKAPLLAELDKVNPIESGRGAGARVAMEAGKTILYSPVNDEQLRKVVSSEHHFKITKEIGIRHLLLVPITNRVREMGVISFINGPGERGFDFEDQLFAEELGRRAGLAIDNAILYERAQKAILARDEFLSIASHELKTPVTSLKLQIQITRRNVKPETGQIPSPEKLIKFLDIANAQVDRLTRLIEDLLDVSRIQAGKITFDFESVDLGELMHDVISRYADPLREAGCELTLQIEKKVMAEVDKGRFEQVMVNLISNSIKYAPGKPVRISLREAGNQAEISVKDSGPGIPAERLPRIFERFERAVSSRNISGLGLGLFITREILKAHGGTIRVISEPGKGTDFIVQLPKAR